MHCTPHLATVVIAASGRAATVLEQLTDTQIGQGRGKHLMPCSAREVCPSLQSKETKPATQLKIVTPLFELPWLCVYFTPPLVFTIELGTDIFVARRSPRQDSLSRDPKQSKIEEEIAPTRNLGLMG